MNGNKKGQFLHRTGAHELSSVSEKDSVHSVTPELLQLLTSATSDF